MKKIGVLLSIAALALTMLSGCMVQQPTDRQVMEADSAVVSDIL